MRGPTLALAAELAAEFGPVRVFRPHVTRRFRPDAPPLRTDTGGVATSPGGCGLAVVLSADALTVTVGHWRFDREQRSRYRAAVDAVESGEELAGLLRRLAADGFPLTPRASCASCRGAGGRITRGSALARRRGLQVVRRWELGPWVSTPEPLERVRSAWRAAAPLVGWLDTHVGAAASAARTRLARRSALRTAARRSRALAPRPAESAGPPSGVPSRDCPADSSVRSGRPRSTSASVGSTGSRERRAGQRSRQ